MGIRSPEDEVHLDSLVYFLSESLRGAIEAGDSLQHSVCNAPQIAPGMDCSQIAEKLAEFRQHTYSLWSDEVLMLAKILRARDLSKDLRDFEPELKPELDVFRLATVRCSDLQDMLLPNVQTMFDGAAQPKRFLEERGYDLHDSAHRDCPLEGYKIAGHTDIRVLLEACEAMHFGLAAYYGFDSLAETRRQQQPVLEAPDDEALLLTELDEIIADETAAGRWSATAWQGDQNSASGNRPH